MTSRKSNIILLQVCSFFCPLSPDRFSLFCLFKVYDVLCTKLGVDLICSKCVMFGDVSLIGLTDFLPRSFSLWQQEWRCWNSSLSPSPDLRYCYVFQARHRSSAYSHTNNNNCSSNNNNNRPPTPHSLTFFTFTVHRHVRSTFVSDIRGHDLLQ